MRMCSCAVGAVSTALSYCVRFFFVVGSAHDTTAPTTLAPAVSAVNLFTAAGPENGFVSVSVTVCMSI